MTILISGISIPAMSIPTQSVLAAIISSLMLSASPVLADTRVGVTGAQSSQGAVTVSVPSGAVVTNTATYAGVSAMVKLNDDAVIESVSTHGSATGAAVVNAGNSITGRATTNAYAVYNAKDAVEFSHDVNLPEQDALLVETGDGVQIDLNAVTRTAGHIKLKTTDIQEVATGSVANSVSLGDAAHGELNVVGNTAAAAATGIASDVRQAMGVESHYDFNKDVQILEEMNGQIASAVDAAVVETRATADAALDASLNAVTEARDATTGEIHNSVESGLSSQLSGGLSL